MGDSVGKERMMKFPYTLTAKMVRFPYAYYFKYAWLPRYWLAGLVITAPIFWKITRMVNSPENVEKWREIRKKQREVHTH